MNNTIHKAVEAYGGKSLWQSASKIRAVVSASGWAFTIKRRPPIKHAQFLCHVHEPIAQLSSVGSTSNGDVWLLEGEDVSRVSQGGESVDARKQARSYFPFGRRLLRWDDLDMAYFANYAFWNYLTLPALLMNSTITWSEVKPGVLSACFPTLLPTHSSKQQFTFSSETGLLDRYDYTAEVMAPFANAVNVVKEHSVMGGVYVASKRAVTPRGPFGSVLRAPLLVDINVHEFTLEK